MRNKVTLTTTHLVLYWHPRGAAGTQALRALHQGPSPRDCGALVETLSSN